MKKQLALIATVGLLGTSLHTLQAEARPGKGFFGGLFTKLIGSVKDPKARQALQTARSVLLEKVHTLSQAVRQKAAGFRGLLQKALQSRTMATLRTAMKQGIGVGKGLLGLVQSAATQAMGIARDEVLKAAKQLKQGSVPQLHSLIQTVQGGLREGINLARSVARGAVKNAGKQLQGLWRKHRPAISSALGSVQGWARKNLKVVQGAVRQATSRIHVR